MAITQNLEWSSTIGLRQYLSGEEHAFIKEARELGPISWSFGNVKLEVIRFDPDLLNRGQGIAGGSIIPSWPSPAGSNLW